MALEADVVEELGERRRVVSAHIVYFFVHATLSLHTWSDFFACARGGGQSSLASLR